MRDREATWSAAEPALRQRWQEQFGATGLEWDEVWRAVRFGWEVAQRPEFRGLDWATAERDLAAHWEWPEEPTEENAWEYVREAVRFGWEHGQRVPAPGEGSSGAAM